MENEPNLKLISRALVKDFFRIPRADAIFDSFIDLVITNVSQKVSDVVHRLFRYGQYVEYHVSYDQMPTDPVPQYVFPRAAPLDLNQAISVVYAQYEKHDEIGIQLVYSTTPQVPSDFHIDQISWCLVIRMAQGLIQQYLPINLGYPIFMYSPTGFRIAYFGGYPVTGQAVIISGTCDGSGNVTLTTANPSGFSIGQTVTVTGLLPAAYNGTFTITDVATSPAQTFTYVQGTPNLPPWVGVNGVTSLGAAGTATLVNTDPLDEYGVCVVDKGLQALVAQKVIKVITACGGCKDRFSPMKGAGAAEVMAWDWTPMELSSIRPYERMGDGHLR